MTIIGLRTGGLLRQILDLVRGATWIFV